MEKTVLVMSRRSPRLQQWALEERAHGRPSVPVPAASRGRS